MQIKPLLIGGRSPRNSVSLLRAITHVDYKYIVRMTVMKSYFSVAVLTFVFAITVPIGAQQNEPDSEIQIIDTSTSEIEIQDEGKPVQPRPEGFKRAPGVKPSDKGNRPEFQRFGLTRTLDDALQNPDKVKRLDLSGKALEELSDDVGKLVNLEVLVLRNNSLSSLPTSLANCKSLREIVITRNSFKTIPPVIASLPSLQVLDISYNSLASLDGLSAARNLREVNLSGNPIEVIGKNSFSGLDSLRLLNMSETQLKKFPDAIAALTSLETLLLRKNALKELPGVVAKIGKLKQLDISYNTIAALPAPLLSHPVIEELHASHNAITNPPEKMTAESLRELNLESNAITEFPKGIGGLTGLRNLNLKNNNIKYVTREIGLCKLLESFDISGNLIESVPIAELSRLPRLRKFSFAHRDVLNAEIENPAARTEGRSLDRAIEVREGQPNPFQKSAPRKK